MMLHYINAQRTLGVPLHHDHVGCAFGYGFLQRCQQLALARLQKLIKSFHGTKRVGRGLRNVCHSQGFDDKVAGDDGFVLDGLHAVG